MIDEKYERERYWWDRRLWEARMLPHDPPPWSDIRTFAMVRALASLLPSGVAVNMMHCLHDIIVLCDSRIFYSRTHRSLADRTKEA
mgnify:CR=1 FL=1